jgi:hypothetical protein
MRVPPGVHRASLGDGAVAVLCVRTGQWQWMNAATERIWSAAVAGTVPELVADMQAEGMPGDVEAIIADTVEQLKRAGLFTDSGPGSPVLPPPTPAVTRPQLPTQEPARRHRTRDRSLDRGPGWGLIEQCGCLAAETSLRLPR